VYFVLGRGRGRAARGRAALHLERGAPAAVHEVLQKLAPVADHGAAVGEQEVDEVTLLEQAGARREEVRALRVSRGAPATGAA
jgi:hypothetical protein